MRKAIATEIFKVFSGLWMVATLSFSVLFPYMVHTLLADSSTAPDGSAEILKFLGAVPIAAVFLGTWIVTRDYYYHSTQRAFLFAQRSKFTIAKMSAGAVAGLLCGVIGVVGWVAVSAGILADAGISLDLNTSIIPTVLGTIVASIFGSMIGVGVGILVPSYYAASAIALVAPIVLELPALTNLPHVGRFFPSITLVGGTGNALPETLPQLLALGAAALWVVVFAIAAHVVVLRRDVS